MTPKWLLKDVGSAPDRGDTLLHQSEQLVKGQTHSNVVRSWMASRRL